MRARIAAAPAPVQTVVRAMLGRAGGPAADEQNVRRLIDAIPGDLTPEEAARVVQVLRPAQSETIDDVLTRACGRRSTLRAGDRPTRSRVEGAVRPASPRRRHRRPRKPDRPAKLEAYRRLMVERSLAFDWTGLGEGDISVVWPDMRTARVGATRTVLIFRRGGPQGSVRAAAGAVVVITSRRGSNVGLRVVGVRPWVTERGEVLDTLAAGLQIENLRIQDPE